MSGLNRTGHIRLTSHPEPGEQRFPIHWGEEDPQKRGPLIGTVTRPADRNVIGATGGAYSLYRALAVSSGALNPLQRPDLRNTQPPVEIGPSTPGAIASRRSTPARSPRASTSGRRSRSPRRG